MHLKYLIKVFDELGLPSIVQDVEINDSQPNLASIASKQWSASMELPSGIGCNGDCPPCPATPG